MNDKVEEITEEKVAEEAAEGAAPETAGLAAAASPAGEQSDSAETTGADERQRSGGRSWLSTLFILVLLAGTAGASGYFILEIYKGRVADQAVVQSLADRLEALQQSHTSLTENVRRLDSRLTSTNEHLDGILHNLNSLQRQRDGAAGWQLAEIKYLFRIASRSLALVGDVDAVLPILESADAGLREIPDPALIPVREQLIADINRLKSAPGTDFTGLALALGDLAERADQLPLNLGTFTEEAHAPAVDPAETENRWHSLAMGIWKELKSLVVISRTQSKSVALLAPPERFFLQRNLRLQLEAARLALLLRDENQFRASVNACMDWLTEFFDTDDARVRNALAVLENTAAVELHKTVPTIDATLSALDEYLTRQNGSASGSGTLQ